jgi:hypothetical protein
MLWNGSLKQGLEIGGPRIAKYSIVETHGVVVFAGHAAYILSVHYVFPSSDYNFNRL